MNQIAGFCLKLSLVVGGLFGSLAAAKIGQVAPAESDFLRACYSVCNEFKEAPGYLRPSAEMNLSPERLAIFDKAVAIKKEIQAQGQFNEQLVREALVVGSQAWIRDINSLSRATYVTHLQAAAIQQYTSEEYKVINPALRSAGPIAPEILIYRDFINAALERMPKFQGMVHRGISTFPDWDKVYVKGQVTTEHAFFSTSADFGDFKFAGEICFLVYSKSGRDISMVSLSKKEAEVLYPAGSRFLVKNIEPNWNQSRGRVLIELEEL